MSQIICPISGEILYRTDLTLGCDFTAADIHPIFKLKKSLILNPDTLYKFTTAKSYREKALYYLSVLNISDLVEFRVPARPNGWIIEQTFVDLCTLVPWIDWAKYKIKDIKYPRYVVDKDNYELKNIGIWLSRLYDIRNLFIEQNKVEDLKKELRDKADEIERQFKTASVLGRAFTPVLAKWALELAGVEEGVFDKWKDMLCTPLEDAWTLQKEDLEEILDHLRAELPINNDQVIAVIHQVKQLLGKSKEGFTSWTFVEDEDEIEDHLHPSVQSKQINNKHQQISSSKHPDELEAILDLSDLPSEPKRSQFTKHFQFLQAKAKWEVLADVACGNRKGEYEQF